MEPPGGKDTADDLTQRYKKSATYCLSRMRLLERDTDCMRPACFLFQKPSANHYPDFEVDNPCGFFSRRMLITASCEATSTDLLQKGHAFLKVFNSAGSISTAMMPNSAIRPILVAWSATGGSEGSSRLPRYMSSASAIRERILPTW